MRATGGAIALCGHLAACTPAFAGMVLSATDEDALCRLSVAEAGGNEPVAGRAAVIAVVLNRVASGMAPNVQAAINSPHQFEPIARAGGDWRRLPVPTAAQLSECLTILTLAAGGYLNDPSNGASHFQNPVIVEARARSGKVKPSLVGFNGMAEVANIGGHRFYDSKRSGNAVGPRSIELTTGAPTVFIDIPTGPAETVFLQ